MPCRLPTLPPPPRPPPLPLAQDPTWLKLQMVATLCNNSRFVVKDKDDDSKPPIDLVSCLGGVLVA